MTTPDRPDEPDAPSETDGAVRAEYDRTATTPSTAVIGTVAHFVRAATRAVQIPPSFVTHTLDSEPR